MKDSISILQMQENTFRIVREMEETVNRANLEDRKKSLEMQIEGLQEQLETLNKNLEAVNNALEHGAGTAEKEVVYPQRSE